MTTPSTIYAVKYFPIGDAETALDSCVEITNKEILKGGMPVPDGLYDSHMGTTDYAWPCGTCGNPKGVCPGHSGSMRLKYPVKSKLFMITLLRWLNAVCLKCGSLITTARIGPKSAWLTNMAKFVSSAKKAEEKEIKCPVCKTRKHKVAAKDKSSPSDYYIIRSKKDTEILYNHEISQIVNRITDQTVLAAGKSLEAHPKKFILWNIKISPNVVRPDTRALSGSKASSSDTTMFIKNIFDINSSLPDVIPTKDKINKTLQNRYTSLDLNFGEMIRNSSGTSNKIRIVSNTGKQPVSCMGQLKGKQGRFRKNLLGKRTEFNIRAVIAGHPGCPVDELYVGIDKAMTITVADTVRPYNRLLLESYFRNRNKTYPGCKEIVDPDTGNRFSVDNLPDDYKLKDGTIVHRHLITGDVVNFNRAPSLWYASIGCHKLRVVDNIKTVRMNLSACGQYNADFDGDSMLQIIPTAIGPRTEISIMSNIGNYMVGIGNSLPIIGAVQDTIVGLAKITEKQVTVDKWHTMHILSGIDIEKYDIKIGKVNTGKEIVSFVLPNINVKTTPKIYMKSFSDLIKYDEDQICTEIRNGKLIRGILDKATLGSDQRGSIFHVIHNEFGVEKALQTIFALQQIGHRFLDYNGFTTGIADILIDDSVKDHIEKEIASKLLESKHLIEKLDQGRLIPPIGMSIRDYFENEQMAVLEPGDDFVKPILRNVKITDNNLTTMIMIGSKGSISNMSAINSAIGPTQINGSRSARNFERGRTSPYFPRWCMDPISLGYIPSSYRRGIPVETYPDASNEARQAAITNALGTSVSGKQARMCVKNLESLITDNLRRTSKSEHVVQPLYGECGIDPRRKERAHIPTIMISDENLVKNFKSTPDMFSDFNKSGTKSDLKSALEKEFAQIEADRASTRELFMHIEQMYTGTANMTNYFDSPVNLQRIIENTKILNPDKKETPKLDPIKAISQVSKFIDNLPYIYFNNMYESRKRYIPEHIRDAVILVSVLVRALLCTKQLLINGIDNQMLELILERTRSTFKMALVQPGWAVGIIAAQSITALLTQFILNSKHRVGAAGGTRTSIIDRFQEITGVRPTKNMKNPTMQIYLKPEYEKDETKVQQIASDIESMIFDRFITKTHIFFENFQEIKHPEFVGDAKFVADYLKYNKEDTGRLSKCCIRFELSKTEMFISHMTLDIIMISLRRKFPGIVFIHNPENSETIIIRCYVKASVIKKNTIENFKQIMRKIRDSVIRGVVGIISAGVFKTTKTIQQADGSLAEDSIFYIDALGTNLRDIISLPQVDSYRTQTDSLVEFEEMYGIEASRNKIIMELSRIINGVIPEHFTIFADEMTSSGRTTAIQKGGMKTRDRCNISLRMGFQSPIEVISEAANNCIVDKLSGVSGPLIMGMPPKLGTNFNTVVISEEFVKEYNKSEASSFESL